MVSDLFQGHKGVPTVERKLWVEPSVVCCISYLSVDLSTVDMFYLHGPDMVSDLFQGHKGVPTVERKVWVEPSGVCCVSYLSVDLLFTVDMFNLHGPDMVSDLFQGHKGVPTVERKVWVKPSGVCCISYLCVDLLLICSICMDLTWFPTCFRATKGCPQWSARCGWSPVVFVASVIF